MRGTSGGVACPPRGSAWRGGGVRAGAYRRGRAPRPWTPRAAGTTRSACACAPVAARAPTHRHTSPRDLSSIPIASVRTSGRPRIQLFNVRNSYDIYFTYLLVTLQFEFSKYSNKVYITLLSHLFYSSRPSQVMQQTRLSYSFDETLVLSLQKPYFRRHSLFVVFKTGIFLTTLIFTSLTYVGFNRVYDPRFRAIRLRATQRE